MEDTSFRMPIGSIRPSYAARAEVTDRAIGGLRSPADEPQRATAEAANDPPANDPPAPSRRRKQSQLGREFTGQLVPAQFKLPHDLVQSLRLHSVDTSETMSEIVLRCLTSADKIAKAWINTRSTG